MDLSELAVRFWDDLMGRPEGPLAFRFILQPVMATLLAFRDGRRDARLGNPPYLHTMVRQRDKRRMLLHEGIKATSRVMLLAVAMDVIYQIMQFHELRLLEAIVIAAVLGFLPYVILRGPITRASRGLVRLGPNDKH